MKHRLFVAIDLSPRVKKQLAVLIEKLASTHTGVKWEKSDKLHLTLKFLGSTPIAPTLIAETIQAKLEGQLPQFVITYGSLGMFVEKKSIIFLEVEKNEQLLRLFHMINNCLESLGCKREKNAFHPHVTLGRSRTGQLLDMPVQRPTVEPMVVDTISIFESGSGRVTTDYTRRAEFRLQNELKC